MGTSYQGRGGECQETQEMLSREQAGARGTDLYEFKASLIYIETDRQLGWAGVGPSM